VQGDIIAISSIAIMVQRRQDIPLKKYSDQFYLRIIFYGFSAQPLTILYSKKYRIETEK
jgi:hypothetical protein